jgi:hypothetical protein
MPFYRQIEKFNRDYRVPIPSSTLNDWFAATCTLLELLYEAVKRSKLTTDYIQVDESPIKAMDNDKNGKTHQGYMWVYHNPMNKTIHFDYRKGRGRQGPKELLANYQGVLQCDGYTEYDKLGKLDSITLAGFLVYVRRKYIDAKDNDSRKANHAINIFSQIYAHEGKAKLSKDRKAYRKEHTLPLLKELKN